MAGRSPAALRHRLRCLSEATVEAILCPVRGLHVASEIRAKERRFAPKVEVRAGSSRAIRSTIALSDFPDMIQLQRKRCL
jgi:hypothetical protein